MTLEELLDTYKNGRRVRECPRHGFEDHPDLRVGTIEGTSLGGATRSHRPSAGNRPMLNVHVKWDDGTESTAHHSAFEVLTSSR